MKTQEVKFNVPIFGDSEGEQGFKTFYNHTVEDLDRLYGHYRNYLKVKRLLPKHSTSIYYKWLTIVLLDEIDDGFLARLTMELGKKPQRIESTSEGYKYSFRIDDYNLDITGVKTESCRKETITLDLSHSEIKNRELQLQRLQSEISTGKRTKEIIICPKLESKELQKQEPEDDDLPF